MSDPFAQNSIRVAVVDDHPMMREGIAQTFSREQDIVDLRLGQRALVDDGSCPTGQIKEVMGSQMTTSGVLRTRKCIQRLGTKKR